MNREEHIAGLRAIADLLERIPELPHCDLGFPSFSLRGTDKEAFAAIDAAASAMEAAGVPFTRRDWPGSHGLEVVVGGMRYAFSRVSKDRRAELEARRSYVVRLQPREDAGVYPTYRATGSDEPKSSPVATYRDAVVDALMDAGIGVRDNVADEHGPTIGIALDPLDARRTPVMAWTPQSGWRIAVAGDGEVNPETIRYVGIAAVPPPRFVASTILRWTVAPTHLLDIEPCYPVPPRPELVSQLTGCAPR